MRAAATVLACLMSVPAFAAAPASGTHDLMPAPAALEWRTGRLELRGAVRLAATGAADTRIGAALDRAARRLSRLSGVRATAGGRAESAAVVVAVAAASAPIPQLGEDESYTLEVDTRGARIAAPTTRGALHGLETLLQLAREEQGRAHVPAVRIEDRPRFPWRGLLVDPSRRWQPVESIRRILDAMAAVKLNVLHWHLSEDQGFRIESRVYPLLHEKGSDGLFYTQDQVREVIAYAAERGIRVVPEFDVPGHSTSWLVAYPELGSTPGPFELVRRWGIFDNNLDPTRHEVYAFLDRFFGEMAALFPDAYFHIGGDEVTPRQWNANNRILDYMYRHRLGDMHDLQAHFNARVNEILRRHGKRMVGWDEILDPALPKDIVVHSWRGAKALADAARAGFHGILSHGYYLDLNQPASHHYLSDPIPPDSTLEPEARARVLGGEACMWGEFVSEETIDSRLWPRGAAVAERLWSPSEVRDLEDMYRRMAVQSARLEAVGATHRSRYEPMLARLVPGQPVAPLRVLADLVEPVKEYRRGQQRAYTQQTPLDRLVDAARPESTVAREFARDADRFLQDPATGDVTALRGSLAAWRDNHAVLEPILTSSEKAWEARPLSRDLAEVADIGLQALDAITGRARRDKAWLEHATHALARAYRPRAELQIAIVPAVCRLAHAAAGEKAPDVCPPRATGGH